MLASALFHLAHFFPVFLHGKRKSKSTRAKLDLHKNTHTVAELHQQQQWPPKTERENTNWRHKLDSNLKREGADGRRGGHSSYCFPPLHSLRWQMATLPFFPFQTCAFL